MSKQLFHDPTQRLPELRGHRIKEAGEILRITPATIYRHARAGKIHLTKIGGRTLVTDAEIARLLRDGAA